MTLVDTWYRRFLRELSEGYGEAGSCHDLSHALRVAILAERLAASEKRDADLCVLAALFHDIGHAAAAAAGTDDHEMRSAQLATEILQPACSAEALREIADAIQGRRFAKLGSRRGAVGEVLDDADNLDALGTTGVARVYMWLAEHNDSAKIACGSTLPVSVLARRPFDALDRHWAEKLSVLVEHMRTDTGRRIARARHARMVRFLREYEEELRELTGDDNSDVPARSVSAEP